jgi:putative oxidoreductase
MNQGLLLLRLVFGLMMAAHGTQKVFGWLGGYGLDGTGGFFEQIGFRPGRLFAALAGGAELIGGLLIAIGFLGPVGPAIVVSVMIVAAATVHLGQGLLGPKGIELTLLYAASSAALALTGFGAFSLDGLLGIAASPVVNWSVLGLGIVGAFANLALRRPVPQTAATA